MSYFEDEMKPKLKPFLDLLKNENLHELQVEHADFLLTAKRETGKFRMTEPKKQEVKENIVPITSNLVGTLHLIEPQSGKPILYEGQEVTVGQLLCLIEAMNILHEVRSPYDGTVKKIVGVQGDIVEYGCPLVMLSVNVKDGEETSRV